MSAPAGALVSELTSALPAGAVVVDPELLESYRHDQALWVRGGRPVAVALPSSTAEVSAVLQACFRSRTPVVPRGAGSGLSGGAAAVDGCVILSTNRMSAILSVDPAEQIAVVQPGVINADLGLAAEQAGAWYPPDPASYEFSTIGGNVATNAGGLCCVKYGVTGDYVLGLEVVLADGRVVRTGRRTVKGVAGYDVTRLMVGSEGTLGVITEVTLRLRRPRSPASTVAAFFPSLQQAGAAVVGIVRDCAPPSLLELMDRTTVLAVDDWKRMGLDREAAALLIAQSDAAGAAGARELGDLSRSCEAAGASSVVPTTDPEEGMALLAARRLAFPALERLGATLLDDVAVPRGALPRVLADIQDVAERHDLTIGTFGHAGDGNLHPTIVFDQGDAEVRQRAGLAFGQIVDAALRAGGTITGEHGVGLLKRDWLVRELGDAGLQLHRDIKNALDPRGILNPGKLLHASAGPAGS